MASFACQTPGGADLCLNGGNCTYIEDIGLACSCPANWQHDFTWFHQYNCTLPENYYLWFLIVMSVLTAIFEVNAFLAIRSVANKEVRCLLLFWPFNLFNNWLIVFTTYLESGFKSGACTVYLLSVILSVANMEYTFVKSIVRPVLAVMSPTSRIRKRVYFYHLLPMLINCSGVVVLVCCLIAYGYDSNPRNFNITACALMFWFLTTVLIHYITSRPISKQLYALLNMAGTHNPTIMKYKVNAEEIRRSWNKMLIMISIGQIPIGTVYLILGSIPYYWVYNSMFLMQIFPLSYMVIKYYRTRSQEVKSSSHPDMPSAYEMKTSAIEGFHNL